MTDVSKAPTTSTSGQPPHATKVKRNKQRNAEPLALAFVFDRAVTAAQLTTPDFALTTASWSGSAFVLLQELKHFFFNRKPQPVSLPITSLRTRLEIADEQIQRLDYRLGTATTPPGVVTHPILVTAEASNKSRDTLNDVVLGWLTNEVARLAQNDESALASVERLRQLAQARQAIETKSRTARPLAWVQTRSHTARPDTQEGFADLADLVARCLEGQVVFPGLPAIRRIITGDLTTGDAELMTDPIEVTITDPRTQTGQQARFSLVVRVQVLTFPGRPGPVINFEFTRRIWATGLHANTGAQRLSAYALPAASPRRALRFHLRRQRIQVEQDTQAVSSTDGEGARQPRYTFVPDTDFAPIARAYLNDQALGVADMLDHGLSIPECRLLIGAKNGVSERTVVKSGVPDRDKADGFDAIVHLLAPLGLTPWHGLRRVKTATRASKDRNEGWRAEDQAQYAAWRAETQAHIRAVTPDGHYHLVIAVYPDSASMASAGEAKRRLAAALDDAIQVTLRPMPPNVHGPRRTLPAANERDPGKRAAARQQAWEPFILWAREHIQQPGQRIDGILVIAPKWYGPEKAPAHDDPINKRAARTALIARLAVPTQYLLPHEVADELVARIGEETPPARSKQLQRADGDFERRLMNAWLDLAFMSQGLLRLERLQRIITPPGSSTADGPSQPDESGQATTEATNHQPARSASRASEGTMSSAEMPDRILALSVVRRNSSRWIGNERSVVPFAVELDVTTGICQASFAYEDPATRTLVITDLQPLPQTLAALARLGPMPLSSPTKERTLRLRERGQEFFAQRLVSVNERSARPLVLVDADTCRSVWPWLTDSRLDPANISVAGGDNAQVLWPSMRMARIRASNSPKVLWDQRYIGVSASGEEVMRYRGPIGVEAELFQLADTNAAHVYLSFGSAVRHGRKQGSSSYRRLPGLDRSLVPVDETVAGARQVERAEHRGKGKKAMVYHVATFEPYADAWTTPTGVEIVVVRAGAALTPAPDDAPQQVAMLVEWLRQCYAHFGEWSIKPAPLHFARLARAYVADYMLDEDNEGDEPETDSDIDADADDNSAGVFDVNGDV